MALADSSSRDDSADSTAVGPVVISGVGVVSPIGIGREAFWDSLLAGRSGVRPLRAFDTSTSKCRIAAEVIDFDAKQYVRPRKALKVMSRDIQLGYVAADLAVTDSGLAPEDVDPERKGVIFGADMIYCELESVLDAYRSCIQDGEFEYGKWGTTALPNLYPLWMLKYLPNMPACHIGIAHDARGPNNSIVAAEASSLQALAEGMRVIQRGQADVVIAGGSSMQIHPTSYHIRSRGQFTQRNGDPAAAVRPFDADRDGTVHGEGAAAFVLESYRHAQARGATILARLVGTASTFETPVATGQCSGSAIRRGIGQLLATHHLSARDIDHVNAHGAATVDGDRTEAQAIREALGDVPVTAPKSYFGNLRAGGGALELAVSVLSLIEGKVPPTLNYQRPDPACPVNVIRQSPRDLQKCHAFALNQAPTGQSVAALVAAAE